MKISTKLQEIIKDIAYQSETDASLEIVDCQKIDFSIFFDAVTKIEDFFGAEEKAQARKWIKLREFLVNKFILVCIYKVGKVEKDILIIAEDIDGYVICLKTKSVET